MPFMVQVGAMKVMLVTANFCEGRRIRNKRVLGQFICSADLDQWPISADSPDGTLCEPVKYYANAANALKAVRRANAMRVRD